MSTQQPPLPPLPDDDLPPLGERSAEHQDADRRPAPGSGIQDRPSARGGHGGHGLMMIICCIPMLVIAGVLFATGVAGSGVILVALLCTAMMAAMMFGMGGRKH